MMRPDIDWRECVKDSPKFRLTLEDAQQDLDSLEVKLDKMVRLCGCVVETGKSFSSANSAFIVGLRDTISHFSDDQLVAEALDKFSQSLSDWQICYNAMLDQCNIYFCKNLSSFMRNDLRKVKESRHRFEKHADELENTLCRNAQHTSRSRLDDTTDLVTHARTCFVRAALEHVLELNCAQKKKRIQVLSAVVSCIGAHIAFVQHINELFSNMEPLRHRLTTQLEDLEQQTASDRQTMEQTHSTVVSSLVGVGSSDVSGTKTRLADCKMEGYLFKRTSNAFKTWVRRWFFIENNQLLYCSRQQRSRYGDNTGATVIERDLRLCNVRLLVDAERRYCFQIISPSRCHVLQADTDAECQAWITAIQDGASTAYGRRPGSAGGGGRIGGTGAKFVVSDSLSNTLSPDTRHHLNNSDIAQTVLSVCGNNCCCDCGSRDSTWASINFGITLCIECSGIHRSLGVHKSKVRSVTLDSWEPEHVKVMLALGNTAVNEILEATTDGVCLIERATAECSRSVRESWIKAKYVNKDFVKRCANSSVALSHGPVVLSIDRRVCPALSTSHRRQRAPTSSSVTTSASFAEQSPDTLFSTSLIRPGASQDSGLGGSTDGIIVSSRHRSCLVADSCSINVTLLESSDNESECTTSDTVAVANIDACLCLAALHGCLPDMLKFLALGANINCQLANDNNKTPLIKAIESGEMAAVEFLLLNGAKPDICDNLNRGPLHHAAQLGHTGHVCLLLKRNVNQHLKDINGLDPLAIAVNNGDANVVTLLRFARLNEEMKQTDSLYDVQDDDTFVAMFRDFTNLANS